LDQAPQPNWTWFENRLASDNAKLAQALIVSGRATGQTQVYERGMEALRWLVGVQASQRGKLPPLGYNGFDRHDGARAGIDQQSIEGSMTTQEHLDLRALRGHHLAL